MRISFIEFYQFPPFYVPYGMYNFLRGYSILENRVLNAGKRTTRTRKIFQKEYCSNRGSRLEDMIRIWRTKFEKSNVPEVDVSLQLIASHVLGVSDVST